MKIAFQLYAVIGLGSALWWLWTVLHLKVEEFKDPETRKILKALQEDLLVQFFFIVFCTVLWLPFWLDELRRKLLR